MFVGSEIKSATPTMGVPRVAYLVLLAALAFTAGGAVPDGFPQDDGDAAAHQAEVTDAEG